MVVPLVVQGRAVGGVRVASPLDPQPLAPSTSPGLRPALRTATTSTGAVAAAAVPAAPGSSAAASSARLAGPAPAGRGARVRFAEGVEEGDNEGDYPVVEDVGRPQSYTECQHVVNVHTEVVKKQVELPVNWVCGGETGAGGPGGGGEGVGAVGG
jgi:hypothetical protein